MSFTKIFTIFINKILPFSRHQSCASLRFRVESVYGNQSRTFRSPPPIPTASTMPAKGSKKGKSTKNSRRPRKEAPAQKRSYNKRTNRRDPYRPKDEYSVPPKPKQSGQPKRPMSSYMLWASDRRPIVRTFKLSTSSLSVYFVLCPPRCFPLHF